MSEDPKPDMDEIRRQLKEHSREHPEVLSRPPVPPVPPVPPDR